MQRLAFLAVALLAGSIVTTEIALTRFFSFKLWYHYAFMIISIALLGLGAAATAMALARRRLEAIPGHLVLAGGSVLYGASLLLSVLLLSHLGSLQVDAAETATEAFVSILTYWTVLFVPFFAAGCTLSWAIRLYADRISAVYAFDLVGAGLGAAAAAWALSVLHPEQVLLAVAGGAIAAGWIFYASGERPARALAAGLPTLVLCGMVNVLETDGSPAATVTPRKALAVEVRTGAPIHASLPNANGRVDVVRGLGGFVWGLDPDRARGMPDQFHIYIDGDALTTTTRWDGDFSKWGFARYMPASVPYALRPAGRVLVIGSGGGMDVVNALGHGARQVTGVEINSRVIEVVRGDLDGFAGGVYRDPRVRVVHGDGRNFVEGTADRYDLIQMTLVDSFAAIASGALSLSEDFLYTTEAFASYVRVLTPDGMLALGRTSGEALPLAALVHAATRDLGLALERHLFIAETPGQTHSLVFVFSKRPFRRDEIRSGLEFLKAAGMRLRYAPGAAELSDPELVRFLHAPDRDAAIHAAGRDIVPETDDRPFYFRSSKWSQILGTHDSGAGNLWLILGVAVCFALGLIVAPLLATSREAVRGNGGLLALFAFLGVGFIFIELGMLTKLVLFLGHPVRSLTVTLAALLIFSGLGSAATRRLLARRPEAGGSLLVLPVAAVAALAVAYGLGLSALLGAGMGLGLAARIALAVALIAPLGFLLGMPLPLAMQLLRTRSEGLVLWAWGLNGVASVVGSVACILLARATGFSATFLVAGGMYLGALLCMTRATRA